MNNNPTQQNQNPSTNTNQFTNWQKMLLQKQSEVKNIANKHKIALPAELLNMWEKAFQLGEKDGMSYYHGFLKRWDEILKHHNIPNPSPSTQPTNNQGFGTWGHNYGPSPTQNLYNQNHPTQNPTTYPSYPYNQANPNQYNPYPQQQQQYPGYQGYQQYPSTNSYQTQYPQQQQQYNYPTSYGNTYNQPGYNTYGYNQPVTNPMNQMNRSNFLLKCNSGT